jgi:hypothetical protein
VGGRGRDGGVVKRYRNITRMDYERTHGYWVRFQFGASLPGQREVIQKLFADLAHGGKRKALAAAIAWRDETRAKLVRKGRIAA